MTQLTALDVVRGAHDAMTHAGTTTGTYVNPVTGGLCLTGALRVGSGMAGLTQGVGDRVFRLTPILQRSSLSGRRAYSEALRAVADQIRKQEGIVPANIAGVLADPGDAQALEEFVYVNNESQIVRYNDNVCRGGEETLLILKKTIHELETGTPEGTL